MLNLTNTTFISNVEIFEQAEEELDQDTLVTAGTEIVDEVTVQISLIVGSRQLVDNYLLSRYLNASVAAAKMINVHNKSMPTTHLALVAAGVESGLLGDSGVDSLALEVQQVKGWNTRACLQGTDTTLMVAAEVLSQATWSLETRNR